MKNKRKVHKRKKNKLNRIKKIEIKKTKIKIKSTNETVISLDFRVNFDSVNEALKHIYDSFKLNNSSDKIKPMIWKFQIYALCGNRTYVDRQLNIMKNNKEIRVLKMGKNTPDYITIMMEKDYHCILKNQIRAPDDESLIDRFIVFIKEIGTLSLSKSELISTFMDTEISKLVYLGALTLREPNVWWLSTPANGLFLTKFNIGEKTILSLINRSKYKQILLNSVYLRKICKDSVPFGISYYLYSLLGNDDITWYFWYISGNASYLFSSEIDTGLQVRLRNTIQ